MGLEKGCPCCKVHEGGTTFEKVMHLKSTGLVIYRYTTSLPEKTFITKNNVFIIHNTKNRHVSLSNSMSEFEESVYCQRCRYIIKHAKDLLTNLPLIEKKGVIGICDHCRFGERINKLCKCQEVVKEFINRKDIKKRETRESDIKHVNELLSKMKDILIEAPKTEQTGRSLTRKETHSESPINKLSVSYKKCVTYEDVFDYDEKSGNIRKHLQSLRDFVGPMVTTKLYKNKSDSDLSDFSDAERREKDIESKKNILLKSTEDNGKLISFTESSEHMSLDEQYKNLPDGIQKWPPEEQTSHKGKRMKSEKVHHYSSDDIHRLRRHHERPEIWQKEENKFIKKNQKQTRSYSIIRRYSSEESLLRSVSEATREVLKKDFSYFFLKESDHIKKIQQKHISSSELIKDTKDMYRTRAEEEIIKKEKELKQKLEAEEKKRIAKEERRKRLEEEERIKAIKRQLAEEEEKKKQHEAESQKLSQQKEEKSSKESSEKSKSIKVKTELKESKIDKSDKISKLDKSDKKNKIDKSVKETKKEKSERESKKDKFEKESSVEKSEKESSKSKKESNKQDKDLLKKEKKIEKFEKEEQARIAKEEKQRQKEEKEREKALKDEQARLDKEEKQRQKAENDREKALWEEKIRATKKEKQSNEDEIEKEKEVNKRKKLEKENIKDREERDTTEARKKFKSLKETTPEMKSEKPQTEKVQEKPITKELNLNQVKIRKASADDLIMQLVKLKQSEGGTRQRPTRMSQINIPNKTLLTHKGHKNVKDEECLICMDSDLELDIENIFLNERKSEESNDIIIGTKIFKYKPPLVLNTVEEKESPLYFASKHTEGDAVLNAQEVKDHIVEEKEPKRPPILSGNYVEQEFAKGIIRYALSDRTFIEKGWTMLPTEKVVRKMNVYRMRPAHPEFDWFEHNKNKKLICYDTGEKLAEFDDNGKGRWFYRSGKVALDYYDAEEINAQQRIVIFSSGELDERGRSRPLTILATFDYLGNGIVFDHSGKIRLKYNQTEGVVLDRSIGPVSHWKWHTLNDPPVLQQVMIDTQMSHKDPDIIKLGGPHDDKPRPDNEEMLAIEFDNFIKEKSKKLTQKFKPFQIKMKALKINEYFSLKVLDQATVYLIYRDGSTNLKLNIGMILDHREIVDTDTAEVGEVSNSLERLPARTDSLAGLQQSVAHAQRVERARVERERRLRPARPTASVDRLTSGMSRPPRTQLRTVASTSGADCTCYCRKPPASNLYYDTRLI